MPNYNNQANPGSFVPTTNIWDPSEIYQTEVTSPEFKELMVRLYQNLNIMSLNLNLRDAGYYTQQEFINGQLFFPNPTLNSTTSQTPIFRQAFRKIINFGALPNAGLKTYAHGITITSSFSFTRIYGCATDPVALKYIPLPYAGVGTIELSVDATNINVTTTTNRTAYTLTYIVLEYIKS